MTSRFDYKKFLSLRKLISWKSLCLLFILIFAVEWILFRVVYREEIYLEQAYRQPTRINRAAFKRFYEEALQDPDFLKDTRRSYQTFAILQTWGEQEEALDLLHALVDQHPDNLLLTYQLAIELFKVGRYNEAKSYFIFLLSAGSALHSKDYPDAFTYSEYGVVLDQNLDSPLRQALTSGEVLSDDHKLEKQKKLLPPVSAIYQFLGMIGWEEHDYPVAIRGLSQSLLFNPNNTDALILLALAYRKMGNADEEAKILDQLGRLNTDIASRIQIAHTMANSGYKEEAIMLMEGLLLDSPNNPAIKTALLELLISVKDYKRAIALLEQNLHHNPDDLESKQKLAQIYSWEGDYDKSIELYKSLLRTSQGDSAHE